MHKSGATALIMLRDVPAAIGLLTRLPIPVDGPAAHQRGAAAAWAYPIAGLCVALIAGVIGQICQWMGMPAQITAVLVLLTLIVPTGALHEDGLADTADGLWGGWTKERRLEIMKDSRIGAYGVIALILALMLRGAALHVAIANNLMWPALLITAALSRTSMVALMACMNNARGAGLSQSVGRPSAATAGIAGAIAFCVVLVFAPGSALAICLVSLGATALCGCIAQTKIQGQTGDILGATGQVVEISVLIALLLTAL